MRMQSVLRTRRRAVLTQLYIEKRKKMYSSTDKIVQFLFRGHSNRYIINNIVILVFQTGISGTERERERGRYKKRDQGKNVERFRSVISYIKTKSDQCSIRTNLQFYSGLNKPLHIQHSKNNVIRALPLGSTIYPEIPNPERRPTY